MWRREYLEVLSFTIFWPEMTPFLTERIAQQQIDDIAARFGTNEYLQEGHVRVTISGRRGLNRLHLNRHLRAFELAKEHGLLTQLENGLWRLDENDGSVISISAYSIHGGTEHYFYDSRETTGRFHSIHCNAAQGVVYTCVNNMVFSRNFVGNYSFPRIHLDQWQRIDADIIDFINSLLLEETDRIPESQKETISQITTTPIEGETP